MAGESLYSFLLKQRIIYISGRITKEVRVLEATELYAMSWQAEQHDLPATVCRLLCKSVQA